MLTKHCLQEFILDCQLRRLSPRTVKGYTYSSKQIKSRYSLIVKSVNGSKKLGFLQESQFFS